MRSFHYAVAPKPGTTKSRGSNVASEARKLGITAKKPVASSSFVVGFSGARLILDRPVDANITPPNLYPVPIPAKAFGCADRGSIVQIATVRNQPDCAGRPDNPAFVVLHTHPQRKECLGISVPLGSGVEGKVCTEYYIREGLALRILCTAGWSVTANVNLARW
jgi:hypothetical protein